MTVQIVLPQRDKDFLSESLRAIVKRVCDATDTEGRYGLGGENGYSQNFENGVFVMREFDENYNCDCGGDDRQQAWLDAHPEEGAGELFHAFTETPEGAHLAACATVLPNFCHKATGFEVRWHKWIGRSMDLTNVPADIKAVITDCLWSLEPNASTASPPQSQP